MKLEQARKIVATENAKKKWEKYKTPEERREVLKNAHKASREKNKKRREGLSTGQVDSIK